MDSPKRLDKYSESKLYLGLKESKTKALVDSLWEQAAAVSKTIVRYMPRYTLHDERHLLNVLGIMDFLIPEETFDKMPEMERALCLAVAAVHDLGMAISDEEYRTITQEGGNYYDDYQNYRQENPEILASLKHLGEADPHTEIIPILEEFLLSCYIRTTHAPKGKVVDSRVYRHLNDFENRKVHFGGLSDAMSCIKLIAILANSHNHDLSWLEEQIKNESLESLFPGVNLLYPSILLRQADIMDFDVSRTPAILFKHLGIEGLKILSDTIISTKETETLSQEDKEKVSENLKISPQEWKKHLGVTDWGYDEAKVGCEDTILRYYATCYHPAQDKSIRDFVGWIEAEINQCDLRLSYENKLNRNKARTLHLPTSRATDRVDAKITPIGYEPVDACFELDKSRIMDLLMGTSLYGQPELCIRELLQNGMDAAHLRLMKHLAQIDCNKNGEDLPRHWRKVDLFNDLDNANRFNKQGKPKQTPRVELEWGKEGSQNYIRVRDYGVGMTRDGRSRKKSK